MAVSRCSSQFPEGRVAMSRTLAAIVTASAILLGAAPAAQTGKKVFISADMEGISGISASDQLSAAGSEYGRSRKMMADDVNAAIREIGRASCRERGERGGAGVGARKRKSHAEGGRARSAR